ncbi:hypothetical protein [Pectobacterium polaris]|uniref:hypothetical protein n=1 Tax=Pectobacterium polaris TaxID=2042057 RepID=UPI001582D851|nr:hypothetical protein [Pectobacterium polaris]
MDWPYFSPEKASEDAINILNRAVDQERALSPFEIERITRNLDSVKRAGFMVEYHTTAACFYSIVGDINSLIGCADSVFSSIHSEPKDKLQVILSLNNALRYSDIYNFLSSFDDNDSLLEFEDELISYIAKTDFYSEVKSSISFSLSFRDDVEDGIMKERVKIYD